MYVRNSDRLRRQLDLRDADEDPVPLVLASIPDDRTVLVLIEKRQLLRECMSASFDRLFGCTTLAFATVEDWLASRHRNEGAMIVVSAGGRSKAEALADLDSVNKAGKTVPLVLIGQAENLETVLGVLSRGARAYIPTSMSMDVLVQVLKFVQAGGTYVPASLLLASQPPFAPPLPAAIRIGETIFTHRQAAVIEALRSGKANKIIAFELSMRESTVKVHVRNIMRKLRARNRTEVAILANASTTAQVGDGSDWHPSQAL